MATVSLAFCSWISWIRYKVYQQFEQRSRSHSHLKKGSLRNEDLRTVKSLLQNWWRYARLSRNKNNVSPFPQLFGQRRSLLGGSIGSVLFDIIFSPGMMRTLCIFWAMPAFPLVQALKRALVVVDVTVEEVQWLGVVASPEPSEKTLQCGHLGTGFVSRT